MNGIYPVKNAVRELSTMDALKLCIRKWRYIVQYYKKGGERILEDGGSHTCSLCMQFGCNGCDGCPVKEKTGLSACKKTPYWRYTNAMGVAASKVKALKAAEAEVEFLVDILDEMKAKGGQRCV
jgi:hypothetical protein